MERNQRSGFSFCEETKYSQVHPISGTKFKSSLGCADEKVIYRIKLFITFCGLCKQWHAWKRLRSPTFTFRFFCYFLSGTVSKHRDIGEVTSHKQLFAHQHALPGIKHTVRVANSHASCVTHMLSDFHGRERNIMANLYYSKPKSSYRLLTW